MTISRKLRKEAAKVDLVKKIRYIMFMILLAVTLMSSWYWGGLLIFTIYIAVISGGLLMLNPRQIRRFVPGLCSPNRLTRLLVQLCCVLFVLAAIALAGNFTNLN